MTLVIGVDPHKRTHTAAAIQSGSGELVDELTAAARPAGYGELLVWAQSTGQDRLWALEDVRGVSRGLERFLLRRGERIVRVPPKLMADQLLGGTFNGGAGNDRVSTQSAGTFNGGEGCDSIQFDPAGGTFDPGDQSTCTA